jgi:hypothetical protein
MIDANKYSQYSTGFDKIREKLQKQQHDQEEKASSKPTFDNSWKFLPKPIAGKKETIYKIRILPPNDDQLSGGEFYFKAKKVNYKKGQRGQTPPKEWVILFSPKNWNENLPCPFADNAKALYATGDKTDSATANVFVPKVKFFINVLVVSDPRTGDENQAGKVAVWEIGKGLKGKLEGFLRGNAESGIDPVNFLHPITGRDFILNIQSKKNPNSGEEYPSYEQSNLAQKESPLAATEEGIDAVLAARFNLKEKVLGPNPPAYDWLLAKYEGNNTPKVSQEREVDTAPAKVEVKVDNFLDGVEDIPAPKLKEAGLGNTVNTIIGSTIGKAIAEGAKPAINKINTVVKPTPKVETKVEVKTEEDPFNFSDLDG